MAITFVSVVDAGPGYTKVQASDGNVYTFQGDRNWRNNNPGNIEYGAFANAHGAIGSDGRFAVFPDQQSGAAAQVALQFSSPAYSGKTISQAIAAYAPPNENNTAAYAAQIAAAIGVSPNTKLSDLTPQQQAAYVAAQSRVEGGTPGTITGPAGQPVDPAVVRQFSGTALPPANIPTTTTNVAGPDDRPSMASLYGAAPAPLAPPAVTPPLLTNAAGWASGVQPTTTPLQAAPVPAPTPSWLQPTASPSGPQLVRLPSGQMIAPGTYSTGGGVLKTITDDGSGNAVIKTTYPGLAGGVGPGTVAGSMIGQQIGQAADAAKAGAATALGNAGDTLNGAKDQIGALGSNIVSGAGSLLSGLFGNKPPNVPSPPASYLGAANSNGAKANGTDSFTPALGSSTSGALGNVTGAKANDTDGFAPVTTTIRNPAYDAWFAQYGNQGGLATGTSENTVSAKFNDADGSAPPVAPKPVPLAPPKYITKTVQGNSSGGGQQQSSPPPQTFSGSSTGRTYTVGQTYSNNNGTYVAQANGTFARVGSVQSTPSAHQASGSQPSPALAMNGQPIRATGGY